MQQSIGSHIAHIRHLTDVVSQRNRDLQQAYEQAREADRMKDAVIKNVSDQMGQSVKAISIIVSELRQHITTMDSEECCQMSEKIRVHTQTTTELLSHLLDIADRKEDRND
jgi:K+-sensing histidine kinase KdpD